MPAAKARNVLDIIGKFGEAAAIDLLSGFRCSLNPSIEHFVQTNALNFTKQGLSITYAVTREAAPGASPLVGFFAITYKILRLTGGSLSRTSEKRIAKFAEYDPATNTYTLPAPLIAQFGKNDLPDGSEPFTGAELMELTERTIGEIMHGIGGRAVYLECEDEPKLCAFYESLGYIHAAQRYDKTEEAETLYHIYVKFLNPAS